MSPHPHSNAKRFGHAALMAAVSTGLASFALVWQVLRPPAAPQHQLFAAARMRGPLDDPHLAQRELVVAALLSPENLNSAMRDARLSIDVGETAATDRDAIEKVRERLRIELGAADEAGVQTVAIRWTGEASPSAARFINLLASRLAQQLSAPDTASLEAAHNLARQTIHEASKALSKARRRLESAVAAASAVREQEVTPPVSVAEDSDVPHLAPPREAGRDGGFLLGQQLADLESRRQTLSQRLMPEHPEMKALDDEIVALRMRLAEQPAPRADAAYVTRTAPEPIAPSTTASEREAVAARIAAFADELADAQAQYETAAEQERAAWQAVNSRRNAGVVEVESATIQPTTTVQRWQRWLIASLSGLMSFALVLASWPRPRLTFSTVEEVRAVTRLPVVAVSRRSLN